MLVFAIDPSNRQSSAVLYDGNKIQDKLTSENEAIIQFIKISPADLIAIEGISNYGMPVGRDVFDTLIWIGRFIQTCIDSKKPYQIILRQTIKAFHTGSVRAKDMNVKNALVEKYAKHDFKHGKGTKNNPDFFYGFVADHWQAFAVAAYCFENKIEA